MRRFAAAQFQHNFDPNKVLYLTGDINYCSIYLADGKQTLTSRTLKWYSDRWPSFIRIHKGSLVNPLHVQRCVQISPILAHVVMQDGSTLSIGRRRIPTVINELRNRIKGESQFPKPCN